MTARTTRAAAKAAVVKTEDDTKPMVNGSNQKSKKFTTKSDEKAAKPAKANTSKKRKHLDVKEEQEEPEIESLKTPTKRSRGASSKSKSTVPPATPDLKAGAKMAEAWVETRDKQFAEGASPAKNAKANPYNLTPGESPYPNYPHPTPEECQHVNDVLASIHGKISAPKTVPVPSLNSSGCGEVPSVLDALIRTRLSAATNNANSSRAFRGLVDKFGIIKEGVGKGSVNWDKVRNSDVKDIFEAIKSGGLADVKSRDIKKILQMVYEENQQRREELKQSSADDEKAKAIIKKAENNVVTLDHLHELSSEDAFNKLVQYPGVGPKTASCVLLFCMQRPSFAVDTHVFRLTKWLGWTPSDAELKRMARETKSNGGADETNGVKIEEGAGSTPKKTPSKRVRGPPPVTRNSTYSHLDVRIPDDLKYALHYLLIKHGKTCPSCMAKTDGAAKAAWGNKPCPLKELKTGAKPTKKAVKKSKDTDSEAEESSNLSEPGEEEDVEEE